MKATATYRCLLTFGLIALAFDGAAADRELIRDPHFQQGFNLLEPGPGARAVLGQMPGLRTNDPVWDLAQWSSKFPVKPEDCVLSKGEIVCSNRAKSIVAGEPGSRGADLSLAVNAGIEYPQARKSTAEPWVHLLVQQNLADPPPLAPMAAWNFRVEARLKRSRLLSTNDYSPSLHAAQFLVYLTVANRNPKARGYQECFWFGIPIYDNRERIVPAYEAQDFGDTKLFIFTPGSEVFASKSTHDGEWVVFEKDLLPLVRQGLEHARAKGFVRGSADLADYRPLGVFVGWEVPGRFEVDLQIRNLSLRASVP